MEFARKSLVSIIAVVAILAAIVLGVQNRSLRTQLKEGLPVQRETAAPDPPRQANALLSPEQHVEVLKAERLSSTLSEKQTSELHRWAEIVRTGTPAPQGY